MAMAKPSRNEIEVRWKGAQLVARGWPANLCTVAAILLFIWWLSAEGHGRFW